MTVLGNLSGLSILEEKSGEARLSVNAVEKMNQFVFVNSHQPHNAYPRKHPDLMNFFWIDTKLPRSRFSKKKISLGKNSKETDFRKFI